MSAISKHYYRFVYLKSEHWSNLRLRKLAEVDAKCKICEHRDLSNDVHHVSYRQLYDVRLRDLVVLCRSCHKQVHSILDANLGFPHVEGRARWVMVSARMRRSHRLELRRCRSVVGALKAQRDKRIRTEFKQARDRLIRMGLVLGVAHMPWTKRILRMWRKRMVFWSPLEWYYEYAKRYPSVIWPCGEH